ncbi:MAG TPA: hypothetical protein VFR31_00425 [Thermoanaerobaculia bacterium]|nr:hypothetical protein [Thermoanaerobaculia bacterium]
MAAIELDRRSYLGLGKARFTADGSEPRRAFKRFGTAHRDLREVLKQTPEGAAGLRQYHRLLFLGYFLSMLAGLLVGVAAGSFLLVEVLGAMEPKEMTPFLTGLLRYLRDLREELLVFAAIPAFLLAFILDYLAYRSILRTIDNTEVP